MLPVGTLVQNRYLIEQLIGKGGMGAVYRAMDQRFGTPVALKQKLGIEEETDRAFIREAKLLNGLRHPALPRVIDFFDDEHGHFLVMEFIPGEDLNQMMSSSSRPYSIDEVLRWADQLLDTLEYLHSQHPPVVHRDIKPQNLKLTSSGQIILLDFGIAKGGTAMQTRNIQGQSLKFYTPEYAPIEQIQGSGTDHRSDLYSLGATLFHLLTLTPPEDALSRTSEIAFGNADPQRPAYEINPHISLEISKVLVQAMSIQSGDRFSSAAEMRTALRQATSAPQDEQPVQAQSPAASAGPGPDFHAAPTVKVPGMRPDARPVPTPPPQTTPIARQPSAPIIPSGSPGPSAAVWDQANIVPAQHNPPVVARSVPLAPIMQQRWILPFLGGIVTVVFLILMVTNLMGREKSENLVAVEETPTTRATATTEHTATTTTEPEPTPTNTIAPTQEADIPLPVLPPSLPTDPPTQEPAPTVAVAPANSISILTVHQLSEITRWEGMWDRINRVKFSPDGITVAAATNEAKVRMWHINGSAPFLAIDGHKGNVNDIAFAPDGRTIVTVSDDKMVMVWMTETGEPVRSLQGHTGRVSSVAFSQDGNMYASGSFDKTVRIWRASDGAALDALGIGANVLDVAFSPDGKMLAIAASDKKVRLWNVGDPQRFRELEGHRREVRSVAFSPNGNLLASASSDGTVRLWQPSDGSLVRTIEGHSKEVSDVAFSQDGQILATASDDNTVGLWMVDSGQRMATPGSFRDSVTSVVFSPDGRLLAVSSADKTVRLFGVR